MSYNKVNRIINFSLIFLLLFSLCSCRKFEIDVHMFSNIEECENIQALKADDVNIEVYDSPTKDRDLKKLEYTKFFGCKYISEELTFELFAYEFSSNDMAMTYFENVTGMANNPNPTFSSSSGMFWFNRIVVKENKAYAVTCKKSNKDKIIEFINTCFKEEIIKR